MKLIIPKTTILNLELHKNDLKIIEKAGRTAYRSEDKITNGSAEKFVRMLINRKHFSVLEHAPYLSVEFIVDRGISHELVRHRLASYTQESTRYCNYSKGKFGSELKFIIPKFINILEGNYISLGGKVYNVGLNMIMNNLEEVEEIWLKELLNIESSYMNLLSKGVTAQNARSILPNSLATKIIVTANLVEWRHIFKLRTDSAAHPDMRLVMIPLLDKVKQLIPIIFDDL